MGLCEQYWIRSHRFTLVTMVVKARWAVFVISFYNSATFASQKKEAGNHTKQIKSNGLRFTVNDQRNAA